MLVEGFSGPITQKSSPIIHKSDDQEENIRKRMKRVS
jgi:hypothetical protein